MTEASLRAAAVELFKATHPKAIVFRHEDMFRAGVPDTSISWKGITSWWEFKFANPTVKWRGAQAAEMRRLWSTGIPAYYPIYRRADGIDMLIIVAATAEYKNLQTPHYVLNFNHRFLIQFIERVHLGGDHDNVRP